MAISDTASVSSTLYIFDASAAYGVQASNVSAVAPALVQYRWDFGDGSPYVIGATSQASHTYLCGDTNTHVVRVEITDNYGNVVIGSKTIDVSANCSTNAGPDTVLFLPLVAK